MPSFAGSSKLNISRRSPRVQRPDDSRGGGVSLLGWSAGNLQTISFLAHVQDLPKETMSFLESYFRSLIIFDCAGNPAPPRRLQCPQRSILDARAEVGCLPNMDMVLTRKPVHETARAGSEFAGPRWTPTVHRMPLAEVAEPDTMARSQMLIQRVDRSVYAENSRRALFDCYVSSSDHEQMIWPRVDVHVVWCDMTFGDVVYSAHKLERANHMLPWEKPDRFTAFIARIA